jgi:transcriptional regulator with XRE-family HTH domain
MSHPVDVLVGKNIRRRRWLMGMSLHQLADRLKIKFQQIQKYETGKNRVSASRLWEIAAIQMVPIEYYFEHNPEGFGETEDRLFSREAVEFVRVLSLLPEDKRNMLIELMKSLEVER